MAKWAEVIVEKEKTATAVDLARAIVAVTNEEGSEVTIKDATKIIRGLRDGILELIMSGYREIKLGNIAIIKIDTVPEHTARNPKTQESILVPTKLRAIMKFSKTLKTMVGDLDIDIGNDVIVQINEEKAARSEKAKKLYAERAARGNGFGKKKVPVAV